MSLRTKRRDDAKLSRDDAGRPADLDIEHGGLRFPVPDVLTARDVPFVFVTGDDGSLAEHYPGVPSHPKPSDVPALLATLIADTAERTS